MLKKIMALKTLFPFALLAASVVAACQSTPVVESSAYDPLYMMRFQDFFDDNGRGLSEYSPLAAVAGADVPDELPKAEISTIDPAAIEAAIAYAGEMNSSALLIWHRGALVSQTYFDEYGRDVPIVSRSLAKPLATIAVGRAIDTGNIKSLDQPVADFFPEWAGDGRRDIIVRHLLDMRSGLLAQGFPTEPDDILNLTYLHPRHDELIINDYPLVNEPGTRYDYANASSELIAPLIERATGIQYEDWVSREILKPLGARGGEVWMNRDGGTAHSGCCIMLPPETFLRLAILLLENGVWKGERLLPEGYVEEMRTATPQNPHSGIGVYVAGDFIERRGAMNPDQPYGRNFHGEPYAAEDLFLFDGNGHQVGYIIPSAELVILRTGVKPDQGLEWDNARIPNIILGGLSAGERMRLTPQPYALRNQITSLAAPDGREIPLRYIEPVGCETCPLMIFSHGAFSTYDRYDSLLLPLAKRGFRIAAPNHVDSEEHPDRSAYGQADSMGKRIEDYEVIANAFSADTVIAIGHSYGGLIAQLAGGARLDTTAATPALGGLPQPAAIVAISPPGPVPGSISSTGWSAIETPMLVTTGTTDILPGFIDDWRAHLTSYEASEIPATYGLIYDGMDHYMNGAYGRETDLQGEELNARNRTMAHLVGAIVLFADEITQQAAPSVATWQSIADPTVETRTKKGE